MGKWVLTVIDDSKPSVFESLDRSPVTIRRRTNVDFEVIDLQEELKRLKADIAREVMLHAVTKHELTELRKRKPMSKAEREMYSCEG